MKTKNGKQLLMLLLLLLSSLMSFGDDVQEKLNLDYFRTPEAAAFKKYGEESVNEYTGTADISVPLYTIKSRDIEIPLVLRYDASGIKVEQEASWVGLGWNLMVGGCINYVCAGGHDQYKQSRGMISEKVWTEYLTTTMKTPNATGTQHFNYSTDDKETWMENVNHNFAFDPPYRENLSMDMKYYTLWGYGERDFYSANILGKSFKFFIDPVTMNSYVIGECNEEYKIEPTYSIEPITGIGNQPDVQRWKITDSSGYTYYFKNADTAFDEKGQGYNFCWYLTGIDTPLGEKVELSYTQHRECSRTRRVESFTHQGDNTQVKDMSYYTKGYSMVMSSCLVNNSFLKEIRTSNQIVTFSTLESKECSGRKLEAITVKSNDAAKTEIKKIKFSYTSFGHSGVGGNYAPAQDEATELRLRLDRVGEIVGSDTLATSFFYNELKLPSKRSCAQDFWGYYNGQDNPSSYPGPNGHTLLPTPSRFMSKFYNNELTYIKGADRFSRGEYMQAAMLNKIVYPTGGYTTYEYEANSILVSDFTLTEKYREKRYDVSVSVSASCASSPYGPVYNDLLKKEFTLSKETTFELFYQSNGGVSSLYGKDLKIEIRKWNDKTKLFDLVKNTTVKFETSRDLSSVLRDITLSPGKYYLGLTKINNPQNLEYSVHFYLDGWDSEQLTSSSANGNVNMQYSLECGGLRVKKIRNYDDDDSLVNYVTYNYDDDKGTTGIVLDAMETIDPFNYTILEWHPLPILIDSDESRPDHTFAIYYTHQVSGLTISTGQSRFPAFYASCNPGNVGYSQVTKCKYNAADKLEKRIVTSFINNAPKSMTLMDYYTRFENGKILQKKVYDANNRLVCCEINEYLFHDDENDVNKDTWYSTNMVCRDEIIIDRSVQYVNEYTDPTFEYRYRIWKYPYILSRTELSKTTTTEYYPDGRNIVKTQEYTYNAKNHQVSQVKESTGLPKQYNVTRIRYSVDASRDSTEIESYWMAENAHRLNDVVEKQSILVENGREKRLSTQHTSYTSRKDGDSWYYLPITYSTSIGSNTAETRATYSYDDDRNVCSISVDGMETVYVWSYNGQYPVARIEGLTYDEVEEELGKNTISTLLKSAVPNETTVNSMRDKITNKGGLVTTYTYKPLVGITSQTLPNGLKTTYEYDGFGRLAKVINHDDHTLSTNSYNYKKP